MSRNRSAFCPIPRAVLCHNFCCLIMDLCELGIEPVFSGGENSEAAKWYTTAAERFRRADWKTKALEAATRLGGAPPQDTVDAAAETLPSVSPPIAIPEPALPAEQNADAESIAAPVDASVPDGAPPEKTPDGPRRRHRGRRGGRNRRKDGPSREAAVASAPAQPAETISSRRHAHPPVHEPASEPRSSSREPVPIPPLEPSPDAAGGSIRGRYGDPGLSSRLSLLEMQFRRLLTCTPVKLEEADRAPVGPGVFLLTDSDLTSYYYVEACQTLRIAVANLLRGGASRRGVDSIKPQLADHLGIAESRVSKYLADHCVVRWLQLDDGASHFAHFVTAVLRPTLNE